MDLSMPAMDGWRATTWLKSQRETALIPIVALTGHAFSGAEEKAMRVGCDSYLSKPCLPQDLLQHIRPLLPIADRRRIPRNGTPSKPRR
jgi:CheY-like chemotaxis protein